MATGGVGSVDLTALIAQYNAQVGALQAAIQSVPSVEDASIEFIQSLQTLAAAALATAQAIFTALDAAMNAVGLAANFASGTNPLVMIANVNGLLANSNAIVAAFDAVNKLTRLQKKPGDPGDMTWR